MQKIIYILLTITTMEIGITPLNFKAIGSNNYKSIIDNKLEVIDRSIQANNLGKACSEAIKAASIIKKNISNLKRIEPNYNWDEIRLVLLTIPANHCISD